MPDHVDGNTPDRPVTRNDRVTSRPLASAGVGVAITAAALTMAAHTPEVLIVAR